MRRLILAIGAILLFFFSAWALPAAPGPGAPRGRNSHARLLRVRRKNRHKRPHYKHKGRPRNHHRTT
jgi:hypothetical protein